MKNLLKLTFVILLSISFTACSNEDTEQTKEELSAEEVFAQKTFEIYEAVSSENIPKTDIKYNVYKDSDGFLTAKYELTGKTKSEIQMGSFAKTQSFSDGTTCDGKWSCGKAIYGCLENGQDALISEGACTGYTEYCVTSLPNI